MPKSVRICPVNNSATQSAPKLKQKWFIEYETRTARRAENLMGWVSSGDTLNQVKMEFDCLDDAKKFAESKGWSYTVVLPQRKKIPSFNYTDNFKYKPVDGH